MASSRLRLISRKLIKPSFSTPPSLRQHRLSIMDQLSDPWYMPMAFLYPKKNQNHDHSPSQIVENSLSRILTSYYPLAGRLNQDNLNIDCSDMGATLIEAHVDCPMSEILQHPTENDVIFPSGLPWSDSKDVGDSLLVAQLSHFGCGGKALSVCMSHKIIDGQGLCNFVRDWAATARQSSGGGDENPPPSPQFNVASIFPPLDDPSTKSVFGIRMFNDEEQKQSILTKRFVFDASKLIQLKAKATEIAGIANPTRVEVATALLHKCANAATMLQSESESTKPAIFVHMVNLRPLFNPLLSPNSVANLSNNFTIPMQISDRKDLSFGRLVSELRRAKEQYYEKFKGMAADVYKQEILNAAEMMKMIASSGKIDFDGYSCTSLCRYPLYDVDFGWGKPGRVSMGANPVKNTFCLMDDQNGSGIEALVSLDKQVMSVFESDPDLLRFASPA